MGRKKIQISRITDERNRQVSAEIDIISYTFKSVWIIPTRNSKDEIRLQQSCGMVANISLNFVKLDNEILINKLLIFFSCLRKPERKPQ